MIAEASQYAFIQGRSGMLLTEVSIAGLKKLCQRNAEGRRCLAQLALEKYAATVVAATHLMLRDRKARCIVVLLRLSGWRFVDALQDRTLRVSVGQ